MEDNILVNEHLKKWLKVESKAAGSSVDILVRQFYSFKLKKKKIKNKKYSLIKNTKIRTFILKDCIPTSVGFSNAENTENNNELIWNIGFTFSNKKIK